MPRNCNVKRVIVSPARHAISTSTPATNGRTIQPTSVLTQISVESAIMPAKAINVGRQTR